MNSVAGTVTAVIRRTPGSIDRPGMSLPPVEASSTVALLRQAIPAGFELVSLEVSDAPTAA